MSYIQNSRDSMAGWRILALLATAQLIISIDYNIVYVALPDIGSSLGFSAHTLQWVVSAYAVAFGGALLLGGRACDLLGAKPMFVLGLSLYAGASLLGGLATTPELLIAARALQGVGGAVLFPATLTLVSLCFPPGRERNRAFAIWGTAGGSGMILGSLLGGALTEAFGWTAVFLVNVPLAVSAATLALRAIPSTAAAKARRRGFDLTGAAMSTLGITAVVYAVADGPEVGWAEPVVTVAGLGGLLLLVGFIAHQRRSADPLLPLRLFADRNLSVGAGITFAYMASFGTLLYFLTLYFQLVHAYSAMETGLAFLVPMVGIAAGAQIAGRAATRLGSRATLVVSLAIGGVGAAVVATSLSVSSGYLALIPGLLILGVGQGAGYTVMFSAATSSVADADQGVGSGMVSTTQQIGGAIGLAALVAVAAPQAAGSPHELVDGIREAFWVAVGAIALTALLALGLRRPTARPSSEEQAPVLVAA